MAEATLYIKDFGVVFRYAAAEKHDEVTWRKHPVARRSTAYRMLMATSEGRSAYVVFSAIVDLCCRAKSQDGALKLSSGKPITPEVILVATGIPKKVSEAAISLLQSVDVGWITNRPPVDSESIEDRREVSPNQSRSDQTGADEIRTDLNQTRPDLIPRPIHGEVPRPALIQALEEAGLTKAEAESSIALADMKGVSYATLLHAAAEVRKQVERGKRIGNRQNYVEVTAKLRLSVKQRTAAARATVARQAAELRTGA